MTKTRPFLWILVPIALILAGGSIWGTFQYGPIGKPSLAASECATLKEFIVDEERAGKAEWNNYRELANQFNDLDSNSSKRPQLVEAMAISVIEVLGHDLAIYKELQKFPSCVKSDRREGLAGIITETESAINFLNGSEAINGNFFNPQIGTWNTAYYSDYVSALDFLKGESAKSSQT